MGETAIETPLHQIVAEGSHRHPEIDQIDLVRGTSDLDWRLTEQEGDGVPHHRPDETLHVELPADTGELDYAFTLRLSLGGE
ncbi:hypothetical protein [Halosimplex amylolyticum]|uniref:hypothetical protein n=1 Tax=Halosimplex amylolyticum TaxID=3396616 RepID=UPI003F57D95A